MRVRGFLAATVAGLAGALLLWGGTAATSGE